MRDLGIDATSALSQRNFEERHVLALDKESKVILNLCEPIGVIFVTPLKFLMNNLSNLTGWRLPIFLLSIGETIIWKGQNS